jgi:hypothetical protein
MKKIAFCLAAALFLFAGNAYAGTSLVKADLNAVCPPPPQPEIKPVKPAKPEKPKTAAEKKAEAKKAAQDAAKEAALAAKAAKEGKLSVAMAKKGKQAGLSLDDPKALDLAKEDFLNFSKIFLIKCDRLGLDTQGRANVSQEGGKYVAVYKEIKMDTIQVEVKRPEEGREHTPFVGHLVYQVLTRQSEGATKEAALKGKFETKDQTMREIFRYDKKKKAWIE